MHEIALKLVKICVESTGAFVPSVRTRVDVRLTLGLGADQEGAFLRAPRTTVANTTITCTTLHVQTTVAHSTSDVQKKNSPLYVGGNSSLCAILALHSDEERRRK